MPKLRGPKGRASAPSGDSEVNELADIARVHAGRGVEIPRSREEAEEAALPSQRAAYERATGKKLGTPPARRQAAHRDERGDEGDEEEEERPVRRSAPARAEEDDDQDEDVDDDDGTSPDDDDDLDEDEDDQDPELESALNALRRAKVPSWVFEQPRKRQLELAGSLAGWQSNADRALRAKDETIHALANARNAQKPGDQRGADDENRDTDDAGDLEKSAEDLARALGVSNDPETKNALIRYAKAGRGSKDSGSSQHVARLERQVQDLLVTNARKKLARSYGQLRTDPDAIERFSKAVESQARTGRYGPGNIDRLFSDAALLEFGPPAKQRVREHGAIPRPREGRAPAAQERRARRETAEPRAGTEDHDRAVFNSVLRNGRRRLSSRR